MGSLYQRGNTWWIKYYNHGKAFIFSVFHLKELKVLSVIDYGINEAIVLIDFLCVYVTILFFSCQGIVDFIKVKNIF